MRSMPDNKLVFLDTETTGLDPEIHQIWEIAFAVDKDPNIEVMVVDHTLDRAEPMALKVGNYWERTAPSAMPGVSQVYRKKWEFDLQQELEGSTLVGANPAYDASMLRARWGRAPWHYRMIDIETYAMPWLRLDRPKGLNYIAEELGVPAPDHTAAGDVKTLQACYYRLRDHYDRIDRGLDALVNDYS